MKSVPVVKPLPVTTMACPGFAEAKLPSAGVPFIAVDVRPVKSTVNGALVPPAVCTTTGPNASGVRGTFKEALPLFILEEESLVTSGDRDVEESMIANVPKRYVVF